MSVHLKRPKRVCSKEPVPTRFFAACLLKMCGVVYCDNQLSPHVRAIHPSVMTSHWIACSRVDRAKSKILLPLTTPESGNAPAESQRATSFREFQLACPITMRNQQRM